MLPSNFFTSIWVVVVAVQARSGEQLAPLALAAKAVGMGQLVELGVPKLLGVIRPPYPTGPQSLIVTFDAQEVVASHLALGWRVPERIVDLMIEFRNVSNGHRGPAIGGLAGALLWFGQSTAGSYARSASPTCMRDRLAAVARLYGAMRVTLDLGRALLRGRYCCAVARIEATGIPVDRRAVEQLAIDWPATKRRIVEIVDGSYGVFRHSRLNAGDFADWTERQGIAWPTLANRRLDLGDDAFREMARTHPVVRPLKELRTTLNSFDPSALAIGRDGRNRTPLRPFASSTGRNQPSTKAFVLGTAAWVRHLIKPRPGFGLALIDWEQQEFGIAAALSGDGAMQRAYRTGDPYLGLAIAVGAAPPGATIASHPQVREHFKACTLGIQYGMGGARLGQQLGLRETDAMELQRHHRHSYSRFWSWSDIIEAQALLHRSQQSVFGWRRSVGPDANPRSLRNFAMQSNGAEMLRLACCRVTEAGISLCAPNHDALLIEAPLPDLDEAIVTTQRLMAEASEIVLDGFELRTSVRVVRAPERWTDPRGASVWAAVQTVLADKGPPVHLRNTTCSPADSRTILLSVYKRGS
jgi:hypothetical protein